MNADESTSVPAATIRKSRKNAPLLIILGLGCGGFLVLGVLAVLICVAVFANSAQMNDIMDSTAADTLRTEMQPYYDADLQTLADSFHPGSTGKKVTIEKVTIDRWSKFMDLINKDIEQYTLEYTLEWSSPEQPAGRTRIRSVVDVPSGEYLSSEVLDTNGVVEDLSQQDPPGDESAVLEEPEQTPPTADPGSAGN